LFPFFFIANTYTNYGKLLDTNITLLCLLVTFISMAMLYLLLYLNYKDRAKSGLLTLFTGIMFLYFGDIKNGLSQVPIVNFISRYTFFLPFFFLLLFFIFYWVRKKKVSPKITLLLNLLLLIYLTIEGFKWISYNQKNDIALPASYKPPVLLRPGSDTTKMPNIIYIVPDCYPSIPYQKEMLGKVNYYFDSSLKGMGFFVIDDARSNTNRTAFSIATTFQMNYPAWLDSNTKENAHVYNKAVHLVKNAAFLKILLQYNYRLYNLSNFDFADKPALKKFNFLSTPAQYLIFYNSLIQSLQREVLWRFSPSLGMTEENKVTRNKKLLGYVKNYNQQLADSLTNLPNLTNGPSPVFVYAHLLLPHFPYFFDSIGNTNPDKEIYGNKMINDKVKFKEYIGYADRKLTGIITSLITKYGTNSVIIIQSDHGLLDLDLTRKQDAFRNYSAFYFPDRNYSMLYRGMSNVNTFRIILNKYFGQQLPILKDSSIYTNK
jgi:hypothetical protein